MSVPPLIDDRHRSRLMDSVDEIEALGDQRRAGGEDRLELREVVGLRGREPRLLHRVDVFGRGAEGLDALLGHVVEERVAVRVEGGAVVEREGRPAGQRAHLPVPHHPAAGGEVEQPLAARHVAVQGQLLEVLEQGPACPVHDALRRPGGAGRVHDVERVVEGEAFEGDVRGGPAGREFVEQNGFLHRSEVGCTGVVVGIARHHDALNGGDALRDRREPPDRVVPPAAVEVAVGAEQHLGRDLPEAVHHPLHPEVRRGGGPDRADARRRQHRHDRLGHVGQVAGDAVALRHPGRPERLREHGYRVMQLAKAQRASDPVLAAEEDGGCIVAAAQEVLGEVEPRIREPLRTRHPVSIDEDRPVALLADHPPVLPDHRPERGPVLNRPAVQRRVVAGVHPVALAHQSREAGEVRAGDPFRGGSPEHLGHLPPPMGSGWLDSYGKAPGRRTGKIRQSFMRKTIKSDFSGKI